MKSLYNSVTGQTRRRPRRRIGEQSHEQKKAILSLNTWERVVLANRIRTRLGNPPKYAI